MKTAYIISHDGVVTMFHEGQSHTVSPDHVNHPAILEALKAEEYDKIGELLDVVASVMAVDERVSIVGDQVMFDGLPVNGPVADKILFFVSEDLPYLPLVRFLENILANPSRRSVNELYRFLENEGMPITEDGMVLGYKGISDDWLDIHSRTVSNKPGEKPSMPRNQVDDDANIGCSVGYHVGSQRYASQWAGEHGRVVLVKFNPADAVSVPHESHEKLRVCQYEVIQEIDKGRILDEGLSTIGETPEYLTAHCMGCDGGDVCVCD